MIEMPIADNANSKLPLIDAMMYDVGMQHEVMP